MRRLVVARRVDFTLEAEQERLRDGLSVEDVLLSARVQWSVKRRRDDRNDVELDDEARAIIVRMYRYVEALELELDRREAAELHHLPDRWSERKRDLAPGRG